MLCALENDTPELIGRCAIGESVHGGERRQQRVDFAGVQRRKRKFEDGKLIGGGPGLAGEAINCRPQFCDQAPQPITRPAPVFGRIGRESLEGTQQI